MANRLGKSVAEFVTPWQASKAARLKRRIAAGKTYNNWLKRHREELAKKPSASNLATGIDEGTGSKPIRRGVSGGARRNTGTVTNRITSKTSNLSERERPNTSGA